MHWRAAATLIVIPLLATTVSGQQNVIRTSLPGLAFQFEPCMTPDQRNTVIENLTRSLTDPVTGAAPDVRSTCTEPDRWLLGTETLGVWLTTLPPDGVYDPQALRLIVDASRRRGLEAVNLLGVEEMFAWSASADFLESLRARAWDALPKRFDDHGNPDDDGDLHVTGLSLRLVEPDRIRTEVHGYYEVPISDVDFELRIDDTISMVDGKLHLEGDTNLDVNTGLFSGLAGVLTAIFAPLGLDAFDSIERNENAAHPPAGIESQAFGALIVQTAPDQVMIAGPSKLDFTHERFRIDESGVGGGGSFRIVRRAPAVVIGGPTGAVAEARSVTLRFSIAPIDLRSTDDQRLQVEWSSDGAVARPNRQTTNIEFTIPGNVRHWDWIEQDVSVVVTDADGLVARHRRTLRIQYNPTGRPEVCLSRPHLPQCGREDDRRR